MGISKTLGSLIGVTLALVLLWRFIPIVSLLFAGTVASAGLGDRETGVVGLLPLIIVIIIVLGSAAVVRSKLKR